MLPQLNGWHNVNCLILVAMDMVAQKRDSKEKERGDKSVILDCEG